MSGVFIYYLNVLETGLQSPSYKANLCTKFLSPSQRSGWVGTTSCRTKRQTLILYWNQLWHERGHAVNAAGTRHIPAQHSLAGLARFILTLSTRCVCVRTCGCPLLVSREYSCLNGLTFPEWHWRLDPICPLQNKSDDPAPGTHPYRQKYVPGMN